MFKSLLDKFKGKKSMAKSDFITLTRVYKVAKTGAIKTQPLTLSAVGVNSVRPSNRLGMKQHSTITIDGGVEYDVAEKYSDIQRKLGAR